MTQPEYLQEFERLCLAELALTKKKNADYADPNNAFANFDIITHLSAGRITAEEGFVVRMSDKLQRVVNLISRPNVVQDEKIEDTLFDLAVYCKLFQCYLKDKNENKRKSTTTPETTITQSGPPLQIDFQEARNNGRKAYNKASRKQEHLKF